MSADCHSKTRSRSPSPQRGSPLRSHPFDHGTFFILQYKSRRVLIGPPRDYAQLQLSIRRHFPDIPLNHRVTYHTNQMAICLGETVEVSQDIWERAIPLLKGLTVETEPRPAGCHEPIASICEIKEERDCGPASPHARGRIVLESLPAAHHPAHHHAAHHASIHHVEPRRLTLRITTIDNHFYSVQCLSNSSLHTILSEAAVRSKFGFDYGQELKAMYLGSATCTSSFGNHWETCRHVGLDTVKDGAEICIFPVFKC